MKTVDELERVFAAADGIILTDYRGLTTAQLSELRSALRGNAVFAVAKNTHARIAATRAGLESFASFLSGPSALAIIHGDATATARVLLEFAKTAPLEVKGGTLEGLALDAGDVKILADTPSREILLAMLAGAMQAHMVRAVTVFTALKEKADG
jgi:large subunit ribosomal protein L10